MSNSAKKSPLSIFWRAVSKSLGMLVDDIQRLPPDEHRKRAEQKHGGPMRVNTDPITTVIDTDQVKKEQDEALKGD